MCDPIMDLGTGKRKLILKIINGTIDKIWIKILIWYYCINIKFLKLSLYCGYVGKCPCY